MSKKTLRLLSSNIDVRLTRVRYNRVAAQTYLFVFSYCHYFKLNTLTLIYFCRKLYLRSKTFAHAVRIRNRDIRHGNCLTRWRCQFSTHFSVEGQHICRGYCKHSRASAVFLTIAHETEPIPIDYSICSLCSLHVGICTCTASNDRIVSKAKCCTPLREWRKISHSNGINIRQSKSTLSGNRIAVNTAVAELHVHM